MKKKLRALIVDDERLARKDLRTLLEDVPKVEVIGEADSVASAVTAIGETDPDLIFLDIQMPGESGFDLLEKTDLRARVIFVTAFDEYAIRAFEVDAVDYLLKPVSPQRLTAAIERLDRKNAVAAGGRRALAYDDTLFLSINNHLKFVKVSAIQSIQAAADYSEIILADGKRGLVQKSMAEWEQRLPPAQFCRIHRSTIINLQAVSRVEEWFGDSYHVYLSGVESPLVMSRRYAVRLKERLS